VTDLRLIPHHLDQEQRTCRAIIETAKGQRCKFDFDPVTGLFELVGVL
jgi:inorganic pyrophosphatase